MQLPGDYHQLVFESFVVYCGAYLSRVIPALERQLTPNDNLIVHPNPAPDNVLSNHISENIIYFAVVCVPLSLLSVKGFSCLSSLLLR
jgi:hypothetical protein